MSDAHGAKERDALRASVWVRDVHEEGIEPHPGPRVVSQNVDGANGTFHEIISNVLAMQSRTPILAALLQEHQIRAANVAPFEAEALRRGASPSSTRCLPPAVRAAR